MPQGSAMSPTGRKHRVRKGTHSCRECRRRKVRCRFAKPDDIVCVTCTARGTSCYSQDSVNPAPSFLPHNQHNGEVMDRLQRLESAMESLIGEIRLSRETSGMHSTPATDFSNNLPAFHKSPAINDILGGRTVEETPSAAIFSIRDMLDQHSSGTSASHRRFYANKSTSSFSNWKHRDICKTLFNLFPSQQVMSDLVSASPGSNFVSTFFYPQHEILQGNFQKPSDLVSRPLENSHPVVLAKHLLQLMICVQHLQPDCKNFTLENRESLKQSTADNVSIVSEIVQSADDICVSRQGLECALLLAIFQLNAGNLRRSWLTVRRALNISQILGLDNGTMKHLPKFDKKTSSEASIPSPQWLWHRVTFFDRYLSLLLGLPPGTKDDPFANLSGSENYTPMDDIERKYTVLTGLIIERNSMKSSNEAFASTQLIDCKFDAVADEMGIEWWEPHRLHMAGSTFEKISSISKTLLQIHHHTLKVFLHLPHLFQREPGLGSQNHRFRYSRETCAAASRSILRLFIPYRNLNSSATACRHVDHSALIGAMTLLMAYLADEPPHIEESHTPATQRQEDSRLLESVQTRFQALARENEDAICHETYNVISRLMPIVTCPGKGAPTQTDHGDQMSQNIPPIKLDVPYIGVITIKPWVLDATRINIERPVSPGIQEWVPDQQTDFPGVNVTNDENELQVTDYISTQQVSPFLDLQTTRGTSSSTLVSLNEDPTITTESSLFPNVAADMMEWSLQGIDTNFWNLVQEGFEPEIFL